MSNWLRPQPQQRRYRDRRTVRACSGVGRLGTVPVRAGPAGAEAMSAAVAIGRPDDVAVASTELTSHLLENERGPVITAALSSAAAVHRSDNRAAALTGLVPFLSAQKREPVVAQALAAATDIDRPNVSASPDRAGSVHAGGTT